MGRRSSIFGFEASRPVARLRENATFLHVLTTVELRTFVKTRRFWLFRAASSCATSGVRGSLACFQDACLSSGSLAHRWQSSNSLAAFALRRVAHLRQKTAFLPVLESSLLRTFVGDRGFWGQGRRDAYTRTRPSCAPSSKDDFLACFRKVAFAHFAGDRGFWGLPGSGARSTTLPLDSF